MQKPAFSQSCCRFFAQNEISIEAAVHLFLYRHLTQRTNQIKTPRLQCLHPDIHPLPNRGLFHLFTIQPLSYRHEAVRRNNSFFYQGKQGIMGRLSRQYVIQCLQKAGSSLLKCLYHKPFFVREFIPENLRFCVPVDSIRGIKSKSSNAFFYLILFFCDNQ